MNKRDHVLNAVLLGVGLGVLLDPTLDVGTLDAVGQVAIPVVLGALFPDLDTAFGSHRKTFHNFLVLGLFAAFPLHYANLHLVWVGILTHYVLDLLGNVRGMALLYPYPKEYDVPVGVTVDSKWATVVTLAVTAFELGTVAVMRFYAPPVDPGLVRMVLGA
ncbi:metal-dependent hydrolase [Halobacteriaceae archaeon GCM10025711]